MSGSQDWIQGTEPLDVWPSRPQGARLPRWIETSFLAVRVAAAMVYASGTAVAWG